MNVSEIIKAYLREHGYDGLCNPGECGCDIDDLMPCDSPCGGYSSCNPAYKVPADEEFKSDWGEDAEWMYCTTKPEGKT